MAEILQFKPKQTEKFGFKKVQKKQIDSESKKQLDLFLTQQADLLKLPIQIDPFEMALLLDEQNDPKASEAYQKAIKESDSISDAYCNLGIILSKNGQIADAFDCFTESISKDPRHFESHYNLANLYLDIGNSKLAINHYLFASKIEENYSNLYFNLGLAYALENDYQSALDNLQYFKAISEPEEQEKANQLIISLEKSIKSKEK